MYNFQSAKNLVENIHLGYLCSQFRLQEKSVYDLELDGLNPDLFSQEPEGAKPKFAVEMKSRIFPGEQAARPKNQYEWWTLTSKQIEDYEKMAGRNGLELLWIFLLGHMNGMLSNTPDLCEDSILHRDVYVVPWDAYKPFVLTDSAVRHIGLRRMKDNHNFSRHDIEKGELWIEECIADEVNDYFLASEGI